MGSTVSSVENYLKNIKEKSHLNAFIEIFSETALTQAELIDRKISAGTAGKLSGKVIAVKNNIAVKDHILSCGSKILSNFVSPYHSTAVERLIKEDAVLIGCTNMDEFAMGSSNENSYFGPVLNPHDNERVPGGSSGGSAAAVAADLTWGALGSETGGSVRQPASFCGVAGLKPTYGRVSRFGLVAFASSLDSIGQIAKNVQDIALILEVIAGKDENDSTSSPNPVPEYSKSLEDLDPHNITIGIPVKEYFPDELDNEIKTSILSRIEQLKTEGFNVIEISLSHSPYCIADYYVVANAEASSNLSRYDGARYGYREGEAGNLEEMYVRSRTEGFGTEVKRRIMLGTYALSSGYYDAYYQKARKVRYLIKQDFDTAFSKVDCIITPTTPTTAFRLGEKVNNPLDMYLSDIYTASVNLAGLPAISIPSGLDSHKLPIGLQIIGKPFDEETIFKIANFIEKS